MNQVRLKKMVATFLVGAFAISFPVSVNAKRLHDPELETKSELRERDFRLTPEEAAIVAPDDNFYSNLQNYPSMEIPQTVSTESPVSISPTVSVSDDSIMGTPLATQQQCVKYLLNHNPYPRLKVSAEEIVAYYYEEGQREGIRPDLAFAQALKETGFFRYGGDVVPEQNNYCGLGTTGGGVRGTYFESPKIGVRAHIQHLLAYTSTRMPTTAIVDPRYQIVRARYGTNILSKWYDLNGRWAVPGYHYGQDILKMLQDILVQ